MDLSPTAVFVKVVQAGSFSAAARQLQMPTSTVSAQIARLEQRLGITLLQRSTRALRMTEVGETYFRSAHQGIELILEAESEISSSQKEPQGTLRVTTTIDLLAPKYIAQLISDFSERYPKIHLEVELTQRIVDLLDEGIDVAIRAGELPDSSLISRKVGTSVMVLVANEEYLENSPELLVPEDLKKHSVLQFARKEGASWQLHNDAESVPITVSSKVAINHLDVVRSLILLGKGVSLLPEYFIRDDLVTGRLKRVLPEWTGDVVPIYIVYPSQKYLAAKVRSFIDFAVEQLGHYFQK